MAQMQLFARYEGELLPVVTCDRTSVQVLQRGEKKEPHSLDYQVRAAPGFGEGMVEITDVQADLDPLRNASLKERTSPSATRFRYKANLTADRALSDCFALLTFVSEGSIGTRLIPVRRLPAGKPKTIEAELQSEVEIVGSLHVFSHGLEVRTSEHREPYDVVAYYTALTANSARLSAAELLKADKEYAHELSADGRLLATVREREAKKHLVIYDLASMKLVRDLPVANADDELNDLTWISDHELAYVAEKSYERSASDFNLWLLDTQSGAARVLLKDAHRIIMSVADHPEVLVVMQSRWREGSWTIAYNVRTGKDSNLEEPESGYYLYDRGGNARVRIRYDGDSKIVSFRSTATARWREIDDVTKQSGLRFNFRGAQLLDRTVDVHSIGPDGDTLYVSTRLGTDHFELAAFSMSEGVIKRVIAKHPKYDLTTSDGGLSHLLFAKKSPELLGIIYEAQKPQVVWLDPVYAAVQQAIDHMFPDHVNLPLDWSEDATTFVYFSASDQDPGTYYVFRPRERRLIPLLQRGERLKGRTLARMVPFEITARDGRKIPAYVTRPITPGKGPAPLIVDIHGGPMARDSWGYDATVQFFASRGYEVLQVNYRGSSGYGASYQNAGLRARLDTVVIDDIADGARQLIAQGEVDPKRVAVMGASFGGWATYMSLIKYPDLYRAGIATSAVSNWRKALRDDRWRFDNDFGYKFWKSLLSRKNFAEEEKFIDPFLRAAELKQPVMIVHGEYDYVVHATEAKLMLDALKKHNPNVQALSFPFASHSYWPFADRVIRLNEAALFFDRYLSSETGEAVGPAQ